jgi:hypothetical protein
MNEMAPDQRFQVNEEVAHREVEGQVLLLLPDDYSLYTLNASGKLVWEELARNRSFERIVIRVAERFGIPRDRAREDVLALLADLEARAIVRRA